MSEQFLGSFGNSDVVMQKNCFLQEQKSGKISRTDLRGAMKKKRLVNIPKNVVQKVEFRGRFEQNATKMSDQKFNF